MHVKGLFDIKGKTAVVIGGSGKIGFAMSVALAEAGANVYIGSSSLNDELICKVNNNDKGLKFNFVYVDQASELSVKESLNQIISQDGVPYILINCGVARPMRKFWDDSFENWDLSMQTNARGLFNTCKYYGMAMCEEKRGSIINVSSIYGTKAPDPKLYIGSNFETEPDYPYTKGGMNQFSKYLAVRFAKDNVRVNVISPGGFFNNQPEPFLSKYCDRVPMGRMAYEDDIKGVTLFFASDASRYITGQNLHVDGGFVL
jgi:NAD(P)-dependent dehydrogenase (short-subunit alcohol dehydrogenase family)